MVQEIIVLLEQDQGHLTDLSYGMVAAGRFLAEANNLELSAVLLGHQIQDMQLNISADRILYMDHPLLEFFTQDCYFQAVDQIISTRNPSVIIFGNTTLGSDIAGGLSIKLGIDLINSCKEFSSDGHAISQICGGKILVESEIPTSSSIMITMIPGGYKTEEGMSDSQPPKEKLDPPDFKDLKIKNLGLIIPSVSDVDISKEEILISIGRGIQTEDNITLAEDLAKALGGVVCASRPIIDQGWLPLDRLVGKSGKQVKPKLYIAIGISGAPEHTEAIMSSETIMAINTDPEAPIFDIASYGTETDLFDLLEILVEKVEVSKSS